MNSTAIFYHPDCLKHDTGLGHPESPARVSAIMDALKSCGFSDKLDFIEAPLGTDAQILLVHEKAYLDKVKRSAPQGSAPVYLDPDTLMSRGSLQAALRAVGAACAAVDKVMQSGEAHAFCAVRPPGHHATPSSAMGFCLFNSVAIAARYAMQHYSLERVAIIDFDVHHGNGTQDAFEKDAGVLYISTHQWPHYPGTGKAEEKGVGNLLNLPLPAGIGGAQYRRLFSARVMPALETFRPQLLFASAGFDAHRDDPLAELGLVQEDYRWIGEQLGAVAQTHCGGRMVSLLEGGYNLEALAASAVAYVSAFGSSWAASANVHSGL